MKKILLISALSLFSSQAFAAEEKAATSDEEKNTKVVSCIIEFEYAKTTFDEETLKKCVAPIKEKEVLKYIQIITSATLKGSSQYNLNLTDARATAMEKILLEQFPNTQIKYTSVGKNIRFGKVGIINFVLVAEQVKEAVPVIVAPPVVAEPHVVVAVSEEKKDPFQLKYAFRFGRDLFLSSNQATYFALGADISLQYQKSDSFRMEFGLQSSQLVNDNYLSLYSFYGLGGAYYHHSGFLLGGRGLIGLISDQNREVNFDFGAEGRAGYEYKAYSIFFGAGRTYNTARFGVEFGIKI